MAGHLTASTCHVPGMVRPLTSHDCSVGTMTHSSTSAGVSCNPEGDLVQLKLEEVTGTQLSQPCTDQVYRASRRLKLCLQVPCLHGQGLRPASRCSCSGQGCTASTRYARCLSSFLCSSLPNCVQGSCRQSGLSLSPPCRSFGWWTHPLAALSRLVCDTAWGEHKMHLG